MEKTINRLDFIEELEEIVEDFKNRNHRLPDNISGWNISKKYNDEILKIFAMPSIKESYLEYYYTYDISSFEKNQMKKKLKISQSKEILITPNNTISIVNICNFIQKNNFKKIGIFEPSYFSFQNSLSAFGIKYDLIYLKREDGKYKIHDSINHYTYDLLIITNPIYSTSVYFDEQSLKIIDNFIRKGTFIISDESLCLPEKSFDYKWPNIKNLICIKSPHKLIGMNSIKFSCISFDVSHITFFDQWNDVFTGSLDYSCKQAISHFLSENYDKVLNYYTIYIQARIKEIQEILKQYKCFSFDKDTIGGYLTVYCLSIPNNYNFNISWLKELLYKYNIFILPGFLHGFQKNDNFCFRINLLAFDTACKNALVRFLNYINFSLQI